MISLLTQWAAESAFLRGLQHLDDGPGRRGRAPHETERLRFSDAKKTILVVEDSEGERRAICNAIRNFTPFEVHEAVNGVDGIRRAHEVKPDLIVMDLAMPMMSGLEAALVIKKEMPRVQLVVLTLYAEEIDAPRSKSFGVVRVLSKTDGLRPLLQCLQELLGRKQVLTVDILRVEGEDMVWIEAAETVEAAKTRIKALRENKPGEYVVFNQQTGNKIAVKSDEPNT